MEDLAECFWYETTVIVDDLRHKVQTNREIRAGGHMATIAIVQPAHLPDKATDDDSEPAIVRIAISERPGMPPRTSN